MKRIAVGMTLTAFASVAFAAVEPTPAVQHFLDQEIVAIVHYGLNTYADKEWGYGDTPPSIFNPTKLDARQWVEAAKAGGVKRIILVCKHHDGFCLWPSKLNPDYTIANTPWKGGKGDLVKEVRAATHAAGLEFAAYLSPWDRHHAEYARPAYVDYFHAQWADLMDNYGPITEIWLDGANGGDGWYGGAKEKRKLPGGAEVYYKSGLLLETLFKKSKNAVAFSGYVTDRTVSWPFNEKGIVAEDYKFYRERDGKQYFCPPEADTPLRRTWFWHKNDQAKPLQTLVDRYFESVGRGGVLDLGLAPNKDGLLDAGDVQRLKEFGAYVRAYKASDVSKGAKFAKSGDGMTVTLTLPEARTFSAAEIRENLSKGGMRIGAWRLEADGTVIARGPQVGNCRIARFAPVTAKSVAFVAEACEGKPALRGFTLRVVPNVADFAGKEIAAAAQTSRYPRKALRFSSVGKNTVVADFGKAVSVEGFDYEPQAGGFVGMTSGYVASVSADGKSWEKVSEGEFGNLRANPVMQAIRFNPTSARYLKVQATKAIEGRPNLKPAQLHPVAKAP